MGGYEDANDSDFLRHDPIFKIACERLPVPGEELLASQPTMSRLENHVTRQEASAMRRSFIDRFIASYECAPSKVVLDTDGWDNPTHEEQEQSAFHGYYGQHMYFPVLSNEAFSGFPLVLQLRAGNSHPGKGVAGILRWLFWRLKRAWPNVSITLRADGGFSLPEVLTVCERSRVLYAIGFSSNAVLNRKIANLLEQARVVCCLSGEKARLFDDVYYAAGTWEQPRRIVMKAEWLAKGPNPRFVVTNLELPPQELYDSFYVQQGAARVRLSSRRVLVELAAFCPFAKEIQVIAQRLCALSPSNSANTPHSHWMALSDCLQSGDFDALLTEIDAI